MARSFPTALNEWGGGDYKDLMAGVDEALRKNPWIDQTGWVLPVDRTVAL